MYNSVKGIVIKDTLTKATVLLLSNHTLVEGNWLSSAFIFCLSILLMCLSSFGLQSAAVDALLKFVPELQFNFLSSRFPKLSEDTDIIS